MIRSGLLIVLIWLCLSQITLNQRQYAVKKIRNNRQSQKDFKRPTDRNLNSNRNINQQQQQNHHQSKQPISPKKSFRDYLSESSNPEIVISHDDQWSNDVVNNNWAGGGGDSWNSWSPPSWQTSNNGWQSGGGNGWNGWWQPDPWKDPYKRLSLVKIKPEIQEVYAADVLIRENRNSNFGINGFVQFVQFENYVEVNGIICNLPPGKHAIHIHRFGEISGGCHETAEDFNPYSLDHGAREFKSRHLGDLGNIEANSTGIAVFRFKDKQIKIQDKVRGIIGRSVVIHEFEDDMGLTQVKESKRNGDAGGRLACGVIGISQASNYGHTAMMCNRKNK